MKELAAGDDVEIPNLGLEIAVKEQLNGDLIVDRERAELDAQERLLAVVENIWTDVDLKAKPSTMIWYLSLNHSCTTESEVVLVKTPNSENRRENVFNTEPIVYNLYVAHTKITSQKRIQHMLEHAVYKPK